MRGQGGLLVKGLDDHDDDAEQMQHLVMKWVDCDRAGYEWARCVMREWVVEGLDDHHDDAKQMQHLMM